MTVLVITLFWSILDLLFLFMFHSAFLKRKRSIKCIFTVGLVLLLVFTFFINSLSVSLKVILAIVFLTVGSLIIFDGSLLSCLFLSIVSYVLLILNDTINVFGICALLNISYEEIIWMKLLYVTAVTMSKFILVFVGWLIRKITANNGWSYIQSKWFLLLILFPLISLILQTFIFVNFRYENDLTVGAVIFSLVIAAANYAVLYVIQSIEKNVKQEQEMVMLKQQMINQSEKYHSLEQNYQIQRKMTHEFERHIQTLRDLLDQHEFQSAINYVRQLQQTRSLRIVSIHSGHCVIDVILNQKYQTAQEKNIKMQVEVNDLSSVSIETDALVVLLSNLLDNAIEACTRIHSRREIKCSIIKKGAFDELCYLQFDRDAGIWQKAAYDERGIIWENITETDALAIIQSYKRLDLDMKPITEFEIQ